MPAGEKRISPRSRRCWLTWAARPCMRARPARAPASKMLVNTLLAQSMLAFAEAMVLGEKLGLPQAFLLDTLPNLFVSAPFTKAKAEMIRAEDYAPQFALELMHKDLHLAALTAYENGQPLFATNAAKEVYAAAGKSGFGQKDFAAVYEFLSRK